MKPLATHSRTPETTIRYVRAARKLRARLANDPSRLHEALRQLPMEFSREPATAEEQPVVTSSIAPIQRETTPVVAYETFADCVRSQMDGPILRYSARVDLFKIARRRGIDRFQANLIIAAVMHETGRNSPVATTTDTPQSAPSRWAPALAVVALQSIIIAGVCWVVWG